MNALPAHVANDHNHKRLDNEFYLLFILFFYQTLY